MGVPFFWETTTLRCMYSDPPGAARMVRNKSAIDYPLK